MSNGNNGNGSSRETAIRPERLAPHSVDAEEALLGSLLVNPDAIYEALPHVTPDDFFLVKNGWVWEAMLALHRASLGIDYVTVNAQLQEQGRLEEIGGAAYITYLVNHTPASIYTGSYAQIVQRASIRRRALTAASSIAQLAHSETDDIESVIRGIEVAALSVAQTNTTSRLKRALGVASDVFDEVEHARMAQMEGKPVGLPTGLTDVDRVIGGLQRSDLIIIGGRPSMGKTSWLLSVMLNLLRQKIPVALFSLETSAVQVHQRFVAMETGISTHHMRQGKLDDREWALFVEANARLGTLPYWIDDTPAHAITQMRAQAKRLYHEHGIQALFVDYLQLAVGTARGASNRTQEVSEISRGLKQIARELNIPVVAAAQLNRAVESRADKRPGLADLRESGDIENDADLVAFLYRDSYYHPATDHPNQAEFIVAKQRNGPKDTVLLYFREDQTQFTNLRKEPVDLKSYNTAASFAATSAKD